MGRSESDPKSEPMLIVRHERLEEGPVSRERFWLGDVDASLDDVAGSLDVRVDDDVALLVPVLGDEGSPTLERRLVGAALRELLGRGVTRFELDGPPSQPLVEELDALGFEQIGPAGTWEAGGAG